MSLSKFLSSSLYFWTYELSDLSHRTSRMDPFVLAFVYTVVVHQQGDENPVLCFCELFGT
jgi:hypothetical protein